MNAELSCPDGLAEFPREKVASGAMCGAVPGALSISAACCRSRRHVLTIE
jgi:hypothetical protein